MKPDRLACFGALVALGFMAPVAVTAQPVSMQLDYPPAALLAQAEGKVGYQVELADDGKVRSCKVVATSGSADLDRETCRQLQATGRFKPAVDASGKAIASRFAGTLHWRIPRRSSPAAPH